jgi:hypothetical protein
MMQTQRRDISGEGRNAILKGLLAVVKSGSRETPCASQEHPLIYSCSLIR